MDTVRIALLSWPFFVLFLFTRLPPHRAVIAGIILGTLFLPEIQLTAVSPEAPDPNSFVYLILKFTKPNTTCFSALLGALLFDAKTLFSVRPRWFDLPMAAWCVAPFISDLGVGVGTYDSFAQMRDQVLTWGVPYFLGRAYFRDLARFRDLAIGLVLGGLIYVPLVLLEARLFPFLHERLYGFFPGSRNEAVRAGILFMFRPVAFMSHGLMTALWMALVALVAFWLWRTKAVERIVWRRGAWPVPMRLAALVLLVTAFMMQSGGATMLAVLGVAALYQVRWVRLPILVAVLIILSPLYMYTRCQGMWGDKEFIQKAIDIGYVPADDPKHPNWDRLASYRFRIMNEDKMIPHVFNRRPVFGHGDTGKAVKIPELKKNDEVVTDGFWMLTLGCYGVFGLTAIWIAMLLPAVRLMVAYPLREWSQPALAPVVACAVLLVVYMIDNLSNAMYNPVYTLVAGAVSSVIGVRLPQASAGPSAPPARAVALPPPPPRTPPRPQPPAPPGPQAGRPGVRPRRLPS
jgi:hypothetical protein